MSAKEAHLFSAAVSAEAGVADTAMEAAGEVFDSTVADTRTVAAFKVRPAALEAWLPETHAPNPYASGPFEGANVTMVFMDRILHQDAAGQPKNGGAYRMMALVVPGMDRRTGDDAVFISRVYAPSEGPGPYKTSVAATVRHRLALSGADCAPLSGRHDWTVEHDGGAILVGFDYVASVPTRHAGETLVSSPADTGVARIYRFDQATDVVFSKPEGVDRASAVTIDVSIPELSMLFDGSEELIGLADRPFYTRQTFRLRTDPG